MTLDGDDAPNDEAPILVLTTFGAPSDFKAFLRFFQLMSTVTADIASHGACEAFGQILPRTPDVDGCTFSLWQSESAFQNWAYGPGHHANAMREHRRDKLAERSSFVRCRVLQSQGVWNGADRQWPAPISAYGTQTV